jgi:hypothetical protein
MVKQYRREEMKIKKEHYDHLKNEIAAFVARKGMDVINSHIAACRADDRVKNLTTRVCFDLMHAAGLTNYICDNLYNYMNDDHLETALRHIVTKDLVLVI